MRPCLKRVIDDGLGIDNTTEAAKVAEGAMKAATEANAIVAKLGESSAEIEQVIKVITSIALKTYLLALNATGGSSCRRAGERRRPRTETR